jgi:hypothetical protein
MNSSPSASTPSKSNETYSKDPADLVTITEKVNLTKDQYEILNVICKIYQIPVSEYMQQALVEAMRFDIEEGNFSDALLEKIGCEDSKKNNNSPSSSTLTSPAHDLTNSDLDLLKKLQTQYSILLSCFSHTLFQLIHSIISGIFFLENTYLCRTSWSF